MADDKVCLVVMVACLNSPLAIQNIMEVMVVLVDLDHLLLDLMAN
jgi:hypothetical protein